MNNNKAGFRSRAFFLTQLILAEHVFVTEEHTLYIRFHHFHLRKINI